MGEESGQDTGDMASLCSLLSGASSLENVKAGDESVPEGQNHQTSSRACQTVFVGCCPESMVKALTRGPSEWSLHGR